LHDVIVCFDFVLIECLSLWWWFTVKENEGWEADIHHCKPRITEHRATRQRRIPVGLARGIAKRSHECSRMRASSVGCALSLSRNPSASVLWNVAVASAIRRRRFDSLESPGKFLWVEEGKTWWGESSSSKEPARGRGRKCERDCKGKGRRKKEKEREKDKRKWCT